MSEYTARITWQRAPQEAFTDQRYSRRHQVDFDGGAQWAASSSPAVVAAPMSDASAVDPEEMFVAALSSCHMLWFLSLAATQGFCVDRYRDDAIGTMSRNDEGRVAMTRVRLRPQVDFAGALMPLPAQIEALHHKAHEKCFIANSVKSDVSVEPQA